MFQRNLIYLFVTPVQAEVYMHVKFKKQLNNSIFSADIHHFNINLTGVAGSYLGIANLYLPSLKFP